MFLVWWYLDSIRIQKDSTRLKEIKKIAKLLIDKIQLNQLLNDQLDLFLWKDTLSVNFIPKNYPFLSLLYTSHRISSDI